MTSRFTAWTLVGILAAMLAGTIHAFTAHVLDERLFPRGWFDRG